MASYNRFYEPEYNTDWFSLAGEEELKTYTADFETTTELDDCRVWAWAICDVADTNNVIYGNSIETFFSVIAALPDCKIYFHNLAFDISFMFDFMLKNGYAWEEGRFPKYDKGFTTVISDMNQVYSMRVNMGHGHSVTFWDSLKVIPLSIANEAKAFGLEIGKGDLDYTAKREVGHVITDEEKEYIRRDVVIDAQALAIVFESGLNKMTIGSCALSNYKKLIGGEKGFRYHFPKLSKVEDEFIRMAYRGGFTYVNPKYAGRLMGEGMSFDVNSLYPSVMAATDGQLLPYGYPKQFGGSPFDHVDYDYPLWVAQVSCEFAIKGNHIPCIQLKHNTRFMPTEYITKSDGVVTLTITNVDWELICAQYDITVVQWHGGYVFHASTNLFKRYVDKWVKAKNDATLEGNKGKRQIAKLMLNSLYGKFATMLEVRSRRPELNEEQAVRYVDLEPTERDPVYLPVGVFITSWARYKTITTAQSCGDRFVYSDTDSVKVLGLDPIDIDIDDVRLGAWKDEGHFKHIKALRAKTYVTEYDDGLEVHVAGMPSRCHSQVTFDNFKLGAVYHGKLYQKRVAGGIVLVEDDFQIRE